MDQTFFKVSNGLKVFGNANIDGIITSADIIPISGNSFNIGSSGTVWQKGFFSDAGVNFGDNSLDAQNGVQNPKALFFNNDELAKYSTLVSTSGNLYSIIQNTSGTLQAQLTFLESISSDFARLSGENVFTGNLNTFNNSVKVFNDLTVHGTLTVAGSAFIVDTEHVRTADNLITLNYGEVGPGVTSLSAGIEVDRGQLPNYYFMFDENSDSFKIGESESLQKVATREDSPIERALAYWNTSNNNFLTDSSTTIDTVTGALLNITNNRTEVISVSGNLYSLIASTSASNHLELVAVSGSLYSTIVNTSNLITFNEPAADKSAGTQAIFDSAIVGEAVTFPNLLYQKSDGKWWKSDADAAATMPGLRMALETRGIIPATETVFESSSTEFCSVAMLSATKAIVCYQDWGDSNKGKACILSISETTITAGTPVVFEASKYASSISVAMLTNSKAIVCFSDGANGGKGTAQILSVSEMTITAESQFVFKDASTGDESVAMLTDSKAIVCYTDEGDSSKGKACILSISETTITAGTPVVFDASNSHGFSVAMLTDSKAIVCYLDIVDGYKGKACILSISDTAITAGDVVEFEAGLTTCISVAMLAVDKAIVCYRDDDTKGKARLLSISGAVITTPEAAIMFENAATSNISVVIFDTNRAIVCYTASIMFIGTACILSVTDTTITAETPVIFNAAATLACSVAMIAGGNPVICYSEGWDSAARVLLAGSMADPCSMLAMGRVRDDDWDWTVGGTIYASTDAGGLTQTKPTGTAIAQPVGIAYHADKMIFDPSISITESTLIASSGGSIAISQTGTSFNLEVASAPISNHNNLLGLQGDGVDYFHLNNTQFASISGGIDLSAYTLLTTTNDISGSLYSTIQDVSGYLQSEIVALSAATSGLSNHLVNAEITGIFGTWTQVSCIPIVSTNKITWELVAIDGNDTTNRYASTVSAIHNGSTGIAWTEYAVLYMGTQTTLQVRVTNDGTTMCLEISN